MAQIQKLIQENQKLKYQLEKFKGSNGLLPYVDDSLFKGGYRVVKTITDRDNIDCCHSKQGMIVCVIGEDLSFKEYRLISDCKNKQWEEIQTQVTENDVILVEDYSELSETLTTQKELNLVLKQLILNLQTQIDNIELTDEKVQITENTNFAQIGQTQKDFNRNVSDYKETVDFKNIEQDSRLENLEGINYVWSPTNRTLTLFDRGGTQLSQVSLVSLDNEGTDLRYNATTLSLDLYNADNELLDSIPVSSFIGSVGTQLQLNSNQLQLKDSQGNVLSTVTFAVSNIQGLQTALDGKLDKGTYNGTAQDLKNDIDTKQKLLSSFDESILIETDGNIEGNVSLFTEYFQQQVCELNFIPTQIIGVYQDGIKLLNSEYEIILPKKIKIKEYVDENIQIEYTHLKS